MPCTKGIVRFGFKAALLSSSPKRKGPLLAEDQCLSAALWGLVGPRRALLHLGPVVMEPVLPRPPVPDLQTTLSRYLSALETVVSEGQLEVSRKLVEEFSQPGGPGQRLQRRLKEFAETHDNWVTPLWLDDMYLRNPLPLPVNSNPFFLFPKQQFRTSTEQLRFAAKLVAFALKFKQKIDNKEMAADTVRGSQPLCMDSYQRFFGSSRRPGEIQDTQVFLEEAPPGSQQYFVVAHRNNFFSVAVSENSEELGVLEQLRQVVQWPVQGPATPIGVLTTENRRTWAALYRQMQQGPLNTSSLRCMERCLFVLCLDEGVPLHNPYATIRRESITLDLTAMAANLLHGNSCSLNAANRWYDAFLQFVVSRDGVCGVVVEHSVSEGITVLRMCEEFVDLIEEGSPDPCPPASPTIPAAPQLLQWEVSDSLLKVIQVATKNMNKLAENTDLYILRFMEYGKNFIKSMKFSPDCYIQMALQLTHYKVHRSLVSTYESCSLRRFRLGRVDNIRANSTQALRWVRTMCDEVQATSEEKYQLFLDAMKKQSEIMNYTSSGTGPDNHLLALLELARRAGEPDPDLFKDPSYQEYLHFRLSTSQLPNKHDLLVGYGPVVPDGYGCSYFPSDGHMHFCVSSFFSDETTSSDFFALSLEGSLLQMREMCLQNLNGPQDTKTRGR